MHKIYLVPPCFFSGFVRISETPHPYFGSRVFIVLCKYLKHPSIQLHTAVLQKRFRSLFTVDSIPFESKGILSTIQILWKHGRVVCYNLGHWANKDNGLKPVLCLLMNCTHNRLYFFHLSETSAIDFPECGGDPNCRYRLVHQCSFAMPDL